jgi:hypothetical protein
VHVLVQMLLFPLNILLDTLAILLFMSDMLPCSSTRRNEICNVANAAADHLTCNTTFNAE